MNQDSRNIETLMSSFPDGQSTDSVSVPEDESRTLSATRTRADRIYRGISTGAGLVTLILLVFIGSFLLIRSQDALSYSGLKFFTNTQW